jgi:hypothetical protein
MIDTSYDQTNYADANPHQKALQEYVRALLARQQALDLLETIHHQINQVWSVMRKLLDGAGAAGRAAQAVRIARAALANQAQKTYHSLENRRCECVAALHQAERRANAALHAMLATGGKPSSSRKSRSHSSSSGTQNNHSVSRAARRKFKTAVAA